MLSQVKTGASTKSASAKTANQSLSNKGSKAKIGGECSRAMSLWKLGKAGGPGSEVFKILGKCRSQAHALKMGRLHREAGNTGKADVLEKRAATGKVGKRNRKELADKLREKRKAVPESHRKPTSLKAFAERVHAASSRVGKTVQVGENGVLASHVHKEYVKAHGEVGLKEFKDRLKAAHGKGHLNFTALPNSHKHAPGYVSKQATAKATAQATAQATKTPSKGVAPESSQKAPTKATKGPIAPHAKATDKLVPPPPIKVNKPAKGTKEERLKAIADRSRKKAHDLIQRSYKEASGHKAEQLHEESHIHTNRASRFGRRQQHESNRQSATKATKGPIAPHAIANKASEHLETMSSSKHRMSRINEATKKLLEARQSSHPDRQRKIDEHAARVEKEEAALKGSRQSARAATNPAAKPVTHAEHKESNTGRKSQEDIQAENARKAAEERAAAKMSRNKPTWMPPRPAPGPATVAKTVSKTEHPDKAPVYEHIRGENKPLGPGEAIPPRPSKRSSEEYTGHTGVPTRTDSSGAPTSTVKKDLSPAERVLAERSERQHRNLIDILEGAKPASQHAHTEVKSVDVSKPKEQSMPAKTQSGGTRDSAKHADESKASSQNKTAAPWVPPRPVTPQVAKPPMNIPEQPKPRETPAMTGGTGQSKVFAEHVQEASKSVTGHGRFGTSKVYISHAHTAYQKVHGPIPLHEFKSKLVEASSAGHLQLARADMPEGMNPTSVSMSRTHHPMGAEFHMIRTTEMPGAIPPKRTRSIEESLKRIEAKKAKAMAKYPSGDPKRGRAAVLAQQAIGIARDLKEKRPGVYSRGKLLRSLGVIKH